MTLTLKLASGGRELWLADVGQVTRIDTRIVPATILHGDANELPWGDYGPAWQVEFESREKATVSLIHVVFGQAQLTVPHSTIDAPRESFYVVEYAFLLASNGDTIDRVAP